MDGLKMNGKQLLELMDYCCPTYLGPSQSLEKHKENANQNWLTGTFFGLLSIHLIQNCAYVQSSA